MICLDETATYTHMTRTHGYSPIGVPVVERHKCKSARYTVLAAITKDEVLTHQTFPNSLNTARWTAFVRDHLVPHLRFGDLVCMDNLRIHYNKQAIEAIRETGADVYFFPPYSPTSNPIEESFSQFKSMLRALAPKSAETLRSAVDAAFAAITPENLKAYFKHAFDVVQTWEDFDIFDALAVAAA